MSRYTLLFLIATLVSCSTTSKNKPTVNEQLIEIRFQLKTDTKYKILQEQTMVIGNDTNGSKSESEIWVKDFSDIEVAALHFEVDIEQEKLRKEIEELAAGVDFSSNEPRDCHSENGRTIEFDNKENKNANPRTIGAISLWNKQFDLPERKMKIGDSYEVQSSNRRKSTKTISKYTLDKVERDIAYLSFEESTSYLRDDENRKLSASGLGYTKGRLEYDLMHHFYRLIHREEQMSMKMKFDSPNEEKMKSRDESSELANKHTIRIVLVE